MSWNNFALQVRTMSLPAKKATPMPTNAELAALLDEALQAGRDMANEDGHDPFNFASCGCEHGVPMPEHTLGCRLWQAIHALRTQADEGQR